jgi:hypothetical protein
VSCWACIQHLRSWCSLSNVSSGTQHLPARRQELATTAHEDLLALLHVALLHVVAAGPLQQAAGEEAHPSIHPPATTQTVLLAHVAGHPPTAVTTGPAPCLAATGPARLVRGATARQHTASARAAAATAGAAAAATAAAGAPAEAAAATEAATGATAGGGTVQRLGVVLVRLLLLGGPLCAANRSLLLTWRG